MTDELPDESSRADHAEEVTPPETTRDRRGERDKWLECFLRKYWGALVTPMARKMGDRGAAEDVVQDSLVKALRRWDKDPDKEITFGWVYKVADNTANDRLRQAGRGGEVLYGAIPDRASLVDQDRAAYYVAEDVLAALPRRFAEAFLLCRLAKFTSAEVSSMTGIPAGTVRWMVGQAVSALRQAVDGLEDTDEGSLDGS
ncbi:RNA polymerase sigma factor [Parasphingorhabdus pacifica]